MRGPDAVLKPIAVLKPLCVILSPCVQISQGPLFVPGVWGPYLSGMVPELWLNEGGQSATGSLVSSALLPWVLLY